MVTITFEFEVLKDTNLSIIASSVNMFLIFSNGQSCDIFVVTLNHNERYLDKHVQYIYLYNVIQTCLIVTQYTYVQDRV